MVGASQRQQHAIRYRPDCTRAWTRRRISGNQTSVDKRRPRQTTLHQNDEMNTSTVNERMKAAHSSAAETQTG